MRKDADEGAAGVKTNEKPFIHWAFLVVALALLPACGGEDGDLAELPSDSALPGSELSSAIHLGAAGSESARADEGLHFSSASEAGAEFLPLLTGARTFLWERNQQLLDGTERAVGSAAQSLSEHMSARVTRDNAALRSLRSKLAELGERYAGFETDVRLIETRRDGGTIIARVEELSRFEYVKIRGDEPPYTAFRVEREFVFSKREGGWVIEDVRLLAPDGLAPINEVVTAEESSGGPAAPLAPPSDLSRDGSTRPLPASLQKVEASTLDVNAYYNYVTMANYATTWALGRNPAYRQFLNDCTNFISQAVSAGGWGQVSGWYQSNSAWWYSSLNQSYTWAGAENWFWFATGSGRTQLLSNVWYMGLADVLQMDFDRNSNINHSMMVTYVAGGELYLSYHTTDTLNRSLSSIIAAYPSAWFYAHRT